MADAVMARLAGSAGSIALASAGTRIRLTDASLVDAAVGRDVATGGSIDRSAGRIRRLDMVSADAPIGAEGGDIDVTTSRAIDRSAGRPLGTRIRRRMEGAFDADFSAVRLHEDSAANEASQRIQASAFALGSDIYVRRSAYAPATVAGDQLLAHELSHVLQHRRRTVRRTIRRRIGPAAPTGTRVRDDRGLVYVIASAQNRKGKWTYRLSRPGVGGKQFAKQGDNRYTIDRTPPVASAAATTGAAAANNGAVPAAAVAGVAAGPVSGTAAPATRVVAPALPANAPGTGPPVPAGNPPPVPTNRPPPPRPPGGVPALPGGVPGPPGRPLGGAAVAPVVPAVGPVERLYATLAPTDVDAGKQFLKSLRQLRPAGLNDARGVGSSSEYSNCALDTIGAMVNKTASQASVDVQAQVGGRSGTARDPAFQNETMWATQLLPASIDPLVAAGIIEAVDKEGFAEGKGEILGPAQLYGMIRYLQQVFQIPPVAVPAAAPSGPATAAPAVPTFTIYRHKLPGPEGDPEPVLLDAMRAYPSGTRFAVFVYSSDRTQEVRAHWVYAEKFGTQIAFSDYQKNKQRPGRSTAVDPAGEYLDRFPLSPKPADNSKGFESGSFVALVPSFDGNPPTGIADEEMTAAGVTELLDIAKVRLQTLRDVYGVNSSGAGSVDQATTGSAAPPAPIRIPSPAMVKREVEAFFSSVGLAPRSGLGANPADWIIEVVGHPTINFAEGFAQLQMQSFTHTATAVDAAGAPTGERPAATAPGAKAYENPLAVGLSFVGGTSALASAGKVLVNPALFRFPDLIHEVFHTYTNSSADKPYDEGCTEVFAGIVAAKVQAASANADFAYVYNPDYTPYVARIHRLIDLVGLAVVARSYLGPAPPKDTLWQAFTWLPEDQARSLAVKLTAKSEFPAGFDAAMDALEQGRTGPIAPAVPNADLDREKAAFGATMDRARSTLTAAHALPAGVATAGLMSRPDVDKVADATAHAEQIAANVRELERYYPTLKKARGAPYVALMTHVTAVEQGLATLTGQTVDQVHERYARPTIVTITFRDTANVVAADETVHAWGSFEELGGVETNAAPLRRTRDGFESAPIELIRRRGQTLLLHIVARGRARREMVAASVTVPDAPTAAVTALPTAIRIS